jgi:hypothetical protein
MSNKKNAMPADGRHIPAQGAAVNNKQCVTCLIINYLKCFALRLKYYAHYGIFNCSFFRRNEKGTNIALIIVRNYGNRKKIRDSYLTAYFTANELVDFIIHYVQTRHASPMPLIKIIIDNKQFLWNYYYEEQYLCGKITAQQLFDYVFNYKVAINYSLRFGHTFRWHGQTYYKGINYVFTVVASKCVPINTFAGMVDIAFRNAIARFGPPRSMSHKEKIRILSQPHLRFPKPEIISTELVNVTNGELVQLNTGRATV